jgi:DNA-binding NarL/FixJ family response regulator
MHRIVIADDHPMVRIGIRYSIREGFNPVQIFEAKNGDELIAAVKQHDIDIVLMDLNMPDTDPQQVLQTMLVLKPGIGVIIFSMNKEEIFGMMYLKMGAMGYLHKGGKPAEMIRAIRCVMDGNVYMTREMQQHYLGSNTETGKDNPFTALTRKELEVLRHLSGGASVISIARIMNIGSSTVGTHKASIFSKLRISNLLELKTLTELYDM